MGAGTGNMRRYLWGAMGLFGLLALTWWGFGDQTSFAAELKSTTFQVQGITCGACLTAIKAELMKKPGMADMAANLSQGQVRVDYRLPMTEEGIAQTMADLGYPAKPVQTGVTPEAGKQRPGGCAGCGPNGCGTVASSWRELCRKIWR